MRRQLLLWIFFTLVWAGGADGFLAQTCSDAGDQALCADNAPILDSLEAGPLTYSCFDFGLTQYYSFSTGSMAGGSVTIAINPEDCDSFSGPDDIGIIVVELPAGANPCDPLSFANPTPCYSSSGVTSYVISGLAPDSDFLLIVGSSHDPVYGPCSFHIDISGSAVDLTASIDPFIITLGESATVSVEGQEAGTNITWSPDETLDNSASASTIATPETSTTYTVTSTIGSCSVSDQVTITVGDPLRIFTAFTPNGDGINDGWTIDGIERFEDALVNVYDRWGQNVFRSLGYGSPWDGTNRGKFLPTGAYFYVIELNSLDVSIPPFTGVVSIIR